jgi:hypothetical protein
MGIDGLHSVIQVVSLLKQNGAYVNDSCGIHLHIGVARLTLEQVKNICIQYLLHENEFDMMVPEHRRSNRYCLSNKAQRGFDVTLEKLRSCDSIDDLVVAMNYNLEYSNRYKKLNLWNLKHSENHDPLETLEFRQYGGDLNDRMIIHWISFVVGFIQSSLERKYCAVEVVKTDENISSFTANYFKERMNYLQINPGGYF